MNSVLVSALLNMLAYAGSIPGHGWQETLNVLPQSTPSFTLVPRFILGLRELYARDLQRCEIDTAFGFGSGFGHGAVSAIMFADGQLGGVERGDQIQMEEWIRDE